MLNVMCEMTGIKGNYTFHDWYWSTSQWENKQKIICLSAAGNETQHVLDSPTINSRTSEGKEELWHVKTLRLEGKCWHYEYTLEYSLLLYFCHCHYSYSLLYSYCKWRRKKPSCHSICFVTHYDKMYTLLIYFRLLKFGLIWMIWNYTEW